jgi:hypothetical protein
MLPKTRFCTRGPAGPWALRRLLSSSREKRPIRGASRLGKRAPRRRSAPADRQGGGRALINAAGPALSHAARSPRRSRGLLSGRSMGGRRAICRQWSRRVVLHGLLSRGKSQTRAPTQRRTWVRLIQTVEGAISHSYHAGRGDWARLDGTFLHWGTRADKVIGIAIDVLKSITMRRAWIIPIAAHFALTRTTISILS